MTKKSTLVFGTDPEFFAGKKDENGKVWVLPPAVFRKDLGVDYIPDVKHPVFIDQMKDMGIIIMEDGCAFEETILPSTDWKELFERVNIGKKLLSDTILSHYPDYCDPEVYTLPTIRYDWNKWYEFRKDPEWLMSLIFGCDQDYDADNYEVKGKVVNALRHNKRYGGGHIHVSGSRAIKMNPILAIQSLKFSAGLAAVAFSETPELDRKRTYLYGRPAKFREQKYSKLFNGIPYTDSGVEYRTPSNSWTRSFAHATELFKWAEIGIRNLLEGGLVHELLENINVETQQAIITCDQPKAKELLAYVEARL